MIALFMVYTVDQWAHIKLMPRLYLTVLTTRNETWRLWKRIFKF